MFQGAFRVRFLGEAAVFLLVFPMAGRIGLHGCRGSTGTVEWSRELDGAVIAALAWERRLGLGLPGPGLLFVDLGPGPVGAAPLCLFYVFIYVLCFVC